MYKYAQIDVNNICVGQATSGVPLNQPDMIPITGDAPIGMVYDNGEWIDGPVPVIIPTLESMVMEMELKQAELEQKIDAIGVLLIPDIPEV